MCWYWSPSSECSSLESMCYQGRTDWIIKWFMFQGWYWVRIVIYEFWRKHHGTPHRVWHEYDDNFCTATDLETKNSDHLTFRFHITGKDDGIISIPMKPGTLIYFHAYLLTHHQVHKNGTCSQKGCCLNFSAYANRKLLCYFVKSYHCAKEIMEQESKLNNSLE